MLKNIGFGCMNASWKETAAFAAGPEGTIAALHAALDNGVRLLDTADIYAPTWNSFGHNERLVAEAVRTWNATTTQKSEVIIATKGGITRGPGESWGRNGSMDYLLRAVEASAGRLGVSQIDLWQHHRLDPKLSLKTQLTSLQAVQAQGIAKRIGVSNYSAAQLRQAVETLGAPADGGIYSVQNQLNPRYRQQLDVLEVCEEFGIAYLPWSPLAGVRPSDSGTELFTLFANLGSKYEVSAQTGALVWLQSLSPSIIPLPGVTQVSSVLTSLAALDLEISNSDLAELNAALPASLPLDPDVDFELPAD